MIKPFDLDQAIALPHPYTAPLLGKPDYTSDISAEVALLMALEYLHDAHASGNASYHALAALEYVAAIVAAAGLDPEALKPRSATKNGGRTNV